MATPMIALAFLDVWNAAVRHRAALVEPLEDTLQPEHYRSTVNGEPIHIDDLADCERCNATGRVGTEWRDGYTGRLVQETETCPTCHGHKVVEQVHAHGAYHPVAVEPIEGPNAG